jgi:hypothetical protein
MPRRSNFDAGRQAYRAATNPTNPNPGGARLAPANVANPKTYAVNPEAYRVMQAAKQSRPAVQAQGSAGGGGFGDFVKGVAGAVTRPVTAPIGRAVSTFSQAAGEKALGYGNRSRYQGSEVSGYRQTSGPMAPAQRYENVATNVFMRAGERYGENIESKYQAPVGYAKAVKQVVTHPVQTAKGVKKAVATAIQHPSILGNIAQEVVTSAATDPTTYAGFGLLGGAVMAERSATKAASKATTELVEEGAETAARTAVREGTEISARRATSSGRALEAVENIPRLREEIGLSPEGVVTRARRKVVEKVLPGEQKGPIRAILKEQAIGSPLPPDPGGAFGFRQAKYRATRAGAVATAPSKYSTFEKVGKALYDPQKWAANQPQIQAALDRGQQVSQSLEQIARQTAESNPGLGAQVAAAIGEHPQAAAAAGAAGLLAPGAIGAYGAYQLGQKLLGGGKKPEEATTPDEEEAVMEMGAFTKLGPRTKQVPGRGQQPSMPVTPSPAAEAMRSLVRSQPSPAGGGFWTGRPEFGGSGEMNRFYIAQTQIARGPTQSRIGQRVKGAVGTYADRYKEREQAETAARRRQAYGKLPPGSALPPPLPTAPKAGQGGPIGLAGSKPGKYGNLTAAGRKPFATVFGPGAGQPVAPSQSQAVASTISTSTGTGSFANRGAPANPRQMAFDFGSGEVLEPIGKPEQLTLGI